MNQHDYQIALRRELDAHTDAALRVLAGLFPRLPEKAREIQFGIFPDQDGEGTFSVVIGLDGPDLYVLNKAIEGHRRLFDVVHGETGLTPPVPSFRARPRILRAGRHRRHRGRLDRGLVGAGRPRAVAAAGLHLRGRGLRHDHAAQPVGRRCGGPALSRRGAPYPALACARARCTAGRAATRSR